MPAVVDDERLVHLRAVDALADELAPLVVDLVRDVLGVVEQMAEALERGLVASVADGWSLDDLNSIPAEWRKGVEVAVAPMLHDAYSVGALGAIARATPAEAMRGPIEAVLDQAGTDYLGKATNRLAGVGDAMWQRARKALMTKYAQGATVEEVAEALREVLFVSEGRAETIARTEMVAASNAGTISGARVVGEPSHKQWLATLGPRTRPTHRHADGQVVGIEQAFDVGGWPLDFPGDPDGPPEEVVNCRCTLLLVDGPEGIDLTGRETGGDGDGADRVLIEDDPIVEAVDEAPEPEPEPEPVPEVDPAIKRLRTSIKRFRTSSKKRGFEDPRDLGGDTAWKVQEGRSYEIPGKDAAADLAARQRVGKIADDIIRDRLEGRGIRPAAPTDEIEKLRRKYLSAKDGFERVEANVVQPGYEHFGKLDKYYKKSAPDEYEAAVKFWQDLFDIDNGESYPEAKKALRMVDAQDKLTEAIESGVSPDDYITAYNREMRVVLDEAGVELGGVRAKDVIGNFGELTPERKLMAQRALDSFPRSWIEHSRSAGLFDVKITDPRAYYRGNAHGAKGKPYANLPDLDDSIAMHEFGHRMEDVVPGLQANEWAWYWKRVGDDRLRPMSKITGNSAYADNEVAREDKFANAYMGKDYGASSESFYEIASMAAESFGPTGAVDTFGKPYRRKMVIEDLDLARWWLGNLLTL